ncbi:MAG TPA: V-type ATP synthase subunit I [Candidatus Desulfaltia sp.]|nr:V-type ATP synthase subunit I [Candidatus Desulfaltia sp.]
MGISRMEKVQVLAHSSVKMPLLASLQQAGIVQLEEVPREAFGLSLSPVEISALDQLLRRLKDGLDFLSLGEKKGLLDKLMAQKPTLTPEVREELGSFSYLPVLEEIERLVAEHQELLFRLKLLEKEVEFLLPLDELDLPLSHFRSDGDWEFRLGTLPRSQEEPFLKMAGENPVWHRFIIAEKRHFLTLLLFLEADEGLIEEKLKDLQFSPVYIADPILDRAAERMRVVDVIDRNRREIEEIKARIAELDKESEGLADQREKLGRLYDLFYNERQKIASSGFLGETEKVIYLEGWIRAADVPKLRSALEPYSGAGELYLRPPLPEEDPPVILDNPRLVRPFEIITTLYGLPQRGTIDPTITLAPFFFIFVGLCLSEAGYGAVITLLSLLYLKFGKPKGTALLFARLLLLLGISNIILGTLVGSWFGFPIRQLLLLDPLLDPMKFIILALALGFIQVWLGTLLSLISGLKQKNYLQSILVQGGWLLLVPALIVYALTKQKIAGILALVGAAGVVFFAAPKRNPFARFFGGLYSLYDISKYLGDILSYTRLFALGLSTGVIAMVVNTLAHTALGIPWLGWLLAGLIFLGGHTFNLAISFLGAFVHSMRLQFVEFFTRFFQPGGKPFRPFRMEGKYIDFV